MDGLSVKVFRTYNASITLNRLLYKESVSQTVEEKKADYDRANKEVRFRSCRSLNTMGDVCWSVLMRCELAKPVIAWL